MHDPRSSLPVHACDVQFISGKTPRLRLRQWAARWVPGPGRRDDREGIPVPERELMLCRRAEVREGRSQVAVVVGMAVGTAVVGSRMC
jgi:hypothetical protein